MDNQLLVIRRSKQKPLWPLKVGFILSFLGVVFMMTGVVLFKITGNGNYFSTAIGFEIVVLLANFVIHRWDESEYQVFYAISTVVLAIFLATRLAI